jgi:hypothetical protein
MFEQLPLLSNGFGVPQCTEKGEVIEEMAHSVGITFTHFYLGRKIDVYSEGFCSLVSASGCLNMALRRQS